MELPLCFLLVKHQAIDCREILQGAAMGEALGVLASRMTPAERAERFTSEEIHHVKIDQSQSSTSVELLKATIVGLEHASSMECPSNLDIRIHLHEAYRDWARSSPSASKLRNLQLARATTSGQLGSFTSTERGASDGMLCVSPIGLAFASDPGRAFLIGAEASALADGEFNSYLCAGVVSLIVALIANGSSIGEAIREAVEFIKPLDWPGEVSEVLRRSQESDSGPLFARAAVSETSQNLYLGCPERKFDGRSDRHYPEGWEPGFVVPHRSACGADV